MAAVTSDGKVHVYDLHENKHEPMCEQKIVRKAGPARARRTSRTTSSTRSFTPHFFGLDGIS